MRKYLEPRVASKPPKRGRPKGAKRATTASALAAFNKNVELYLFIADHMAADPEPHGRKARAYEAASEKFGGPDGLARTTIDRRWQKVVDARLYLQNWSQVTGPLLRRLRAAYTGDELVSVFKILKVVPESFVDGMLKDREAALKKTRRN
jgi:hypothetical protein